MVLDIQKVGAAEVLVTLRLAGPYPSRVDFPFEGGLEAAIPLELEAAMDVLEQAAYPRDHHVARAKFSLGVAGLEDPSRHQRPSLIVSPGPPACPRRSRRDARRRR